MTETVPTYDFLPGILAEIAEVAGIAAAMKVASEKGGTRVHIPGSVSDKHWLAQAVGPEAATKICRHFAAGKQGGGLKVDIPLGPAGTLAQRRAIADDMIAQGKSNAEVARIVGYTQRGIERRKAKLLAKPDPRQQDLFLPSDPDHGRG